MHFTPFRTVKHSHTTATHTSAHRSVPHTIYTQPRAYHAPSTTHCSPHTTQPLTQTFNIQSLHLLHTIRTAQQPHTYNYTVRLTPFAHTNNHLHVRPPFRFKHSPMLISSLFAYRFTRHKHTRAVMHTHQLKNKDIQMRIHKYRAKEAKPYYTPNTKPVVKTGHLFHLFINPCARHIAKQTQK